MQLVNLQKLETQRYVYDLYIKRITHFRQNPPSNDWDDVYTFETK
ncbi:MAG: hypothetical protein WCG35_09670 [Betaproteobacteria bacterium]